MKVRFNLNKNQHWQWKYYMKKLIFIFKILDIIKSKERTNINDVNGIFDIYTLQQQDSTSIFKY